MGLYEVPLSISGFGMGTMLANFHVCVIMLLLRAVDTIDLRIQIKYAFTSINGSSDNSLQVMELSGHPDLQIVVNTSHHFKPFPHYSSKPQRPSDSSQSWLRILLSGDVHPNPGPTTKYPCPVCACNVTGRGVSYLCNRCSGWVHSKCSGLQNAAEYRQIKDWVCSACSTPPTLPKPQPLPTSISTQDVDGNSFTIMKFNANGISNKLTELGEFLKRNNVKMAVIQESKLSSNSKTPSIQNFTIRKEHRQGQGGGLLTLIHKSINFSRKPESPDSGRTSFGGVDPHGHTQRHGVDHYQRLHTPGKLLRRRLHSFPGSSDDDDGYPNTGRLQCTPLGLVLKLYKYENMISGSNFGILNWDSPTRLPGNANPSSPDVSSASASLITSTNWQTKTNLGSDHLPILISLQMDLTIKPIPHPTSFNLKKANWDRYRKEIEDKLSKRRLPTNCQKGEKILRTIILKAASRHIPWPTPY